MKISVKMLQGQEYVLDVSPVITVSQLKDLVEGNMNIPKAEQKILLLGKPLLDDKQLCECGVKEGSKLNLIRRANSSPPQATLSAEGPLQAEMLKFLLCHMPANNANRVLDEFMKEFKRSVCSLSVDDLERIAKARLQEENALNFHS